jgi:hypothetical protein
MIVLSESSPQLPPSSSAADIRKATEAARLTGSRVYNIPPDFSQCETAENALAHVPDQEQETPAIWIGYIPTPSHYQAIYAAALEKRVRLLNNPDQHLDSQEFDRAYPRLAELTPVSVTVTSEDQCSEAVQTLGLPVFVKGAVQAGNRAGGRLASRSLWMNCVSFAVIC